MTTSPLILVSSSRRYEFDLETPWLITDSSDRLCKITSLIVRVDADGETDVWMYGHSVTKDGRPRSATQEIYAHGPVAAEIKLDATMAVRRIELAAAK